MAASAIENPIPVNGGESKSAKKKKAKAEAANGAATAVPSQPEKESSSAGAKAEGDGSSEHPHIKELQKQIRSINKKLAGMQKTDAVIAENPGVSLDELIAQRKLNSDQKAAALKKPQLQSQLAQLEEQIQVFKSFESEHKQQLQKHVDELSARHQKELEKATEDSRTQSAASGATELRKNLLIFSQFLRAAAAKRSNEEEAETEESQAFEGALLLVYGGDEKAVDTAISLIEGSNDQVPSIEGLALPVTYAQIKQAAVAHAPFSAESTWVDQVAEANAPEAAAPVGSDPTVANAGLNELSQSAGAAPALAGHEEGNAAGERWDTDAGASKDSMADSFELVQRPAEQNEAAVPATEAATTSWADQTTAHESSATGNQAGESWSAKAGQNDAAENEWANQPASKAADDGFQQIQSRNRGRGGRGRGDGESRGRGGRGGRGGFRGDGEGRGRGRGGFRGGRGGEGGGRGRGAPRGDLPPRTSA